MFKVIYISESQSLQETKVDLKPKTGVYFNTESGNTFKAQIELVLRDQLNLSEDDYLKILTVEFL